MEVQVFVEFLYYGNMKIHLFISLVKFLFLCLLSFKCVYSVSSDVWNVYDEIQVALLYWLVFIEFYYSTIKFFF